ncbi:MULTISPECIES: segregation/condensation protein A [Methanothermococcus]|jgi:segregation and condensation protein A|uniref:segregation/condensation protein A n=1 Tax=Methanothermococcus TaxID=155862 RepID=UPI00036E6A50|nr:MULTISPECIES: segregation/condensation protein A [Methanothermococcus]
MEFELWVRIIKESIEKKDIEPWNINIAEIADEYIGKIKELRRFDIRLSADVVLVAGILLRMKSQILYGECENVFNEEDVEDEEYYEEEYIGEYDVDDSKVKDQLTKQKKKSNDKSKKQMSLNDLISTLKTELRKIKEKKPKKKREKTSLNVYEIVEEMVEEDDISDIMDYLISELEKSGGRFVFQAKFSSRDELIKNFLPSLYLSNDGKITLHQEEIFKDLIVELKNK